MIIGVASDLTLTFQSSLDREAGFRCDHAPEAMLGQLSILEGCSRVGWCPGHFYGEHTFGQEGCP
jgi:hypothetical protein